MSNKKDRIDLTWFERFPQHDEEDCAIITDDTYALNWEVPKLIAELNRMYKKEDDIIEYVGYLLATPDVLEQLMGSPSQIHTINNLTNSLEKLLEKLKNKASE
jgi:hypothetical protein